MEVSDWLIDGWIGEGCGDGLFSLRERGGV